MHLFRLADSTPERRSYVERRRHGHFSVRSHHPMASAHNLEVDKVSCLANSVVSPSVAGIRPLYLLLGRSPGFLAAVSAFSGRCFEVISIRPFSKRPNNDADRHFAS